MQTIAIANQKGGTGKTTTALNLAYSLVQMRRRVLLIDFDPQASLTQATVGDCAGKSIAEVVGDTQPGKLTIHEVKRALAPGCDLAPSDISLGICELGFATRMGREGILRKVLSPVKSYDVCLIDCPPSMGLLTINALGAANAVIAPTMASGLDLRGLRLFLRSLEFIEKELNPSLVLLGVLVTQYDSRLRLHQAALKDMQDAKLPVFPVMISKSTRTATAAGEGKPITRGDLSAQYAELGGIVEEWLKRKSQK